MFMCFLKTCIPTKLLVHFLDKQDKTYTVVGAATLCTYLKITAYVTKYFQCPGLKVLHISSFVMLYSSVMYLFYVTQ
jgi:hypothetical protein